MRDRHWQAGGVWNFQGCIVKVNELAWRAALPVSFA
jgi:hypothetical protein